MKRTTIVCLTASCVLALAGCAQRTVARSRSSASPGPTTVSSSTPGVIPSGTNLEVRTNQDINANKDSVGRTYSGEVATDIVNTSGTVLIPKGSPVQLVVLSMGQGGVTSGGEVELGIQSVNVRGTNYNVGGSDVAQGEGIGANQRTGVMVGGGAALGTLIGAIAGGAKGAVIGAVAGAAAGAGAQVLTRGKEFRIPAESVLTFRTDRDLHLYRR